MEMSVTYENSDNEEFGFDISKHDVNDVLFVVRTANGSIEEFSLSDVDAAMLGNALLVAAESAATSKID